MFNEDSLIGKFNVILQWNKTNSFAILRLSQNIRREVPYDLAISHLDLLLNYKNIKLKGYVHTYVYCCTYNSQDIETNTNCR